MTTSSTTGKQLARRRVSPDGRLRRPRLYIVGEAPGAEEVEQGRPFVGPVGNALRNMLKQAGIELAELRLANAIPFRPVANRKGCKLRNRTPTPQEIDRYSAAVFSDIRRSRPGVIVALGSTAARLFTASPSLRASRNAKLQFDGRPVLITFHPAYARRFGGSSAQTWQKSVADLRRAWKISAMHLHSKRRR